MTVKDAAEGDENGDDDDWGHGEDATLFTTGATYARKLHFTGSYSRTYVVLQELLLLQ
jgi:hypothetical protein